MSFEVTDLIENLRTTRATLLKHVDGLTDEQWTWQPYPQCKSVRETFTHLIMGGRLLAYHLAGDSRATAFENVALEIEKEYAEHTPAQLVAAFQKSHEETCQLLLDNYADKPLDTPWNGFFVGQKLGVTLAGFAGELSYHTGQIAFIRMASDPTWDYYAHIYNYTG